MAKVKTIKLKNGDVFVPVKSFLGQYYLRFRPSETHNTLIVWRVMEPKSKFSNSDVLVGEVSPLSIETDLSDVRMIPFEDMEVIMKMAGKMLGDVLYPVRTKAETRLK